MQDPYTAFAARADLDQEEMERMRRDIKKKKAQIDDLERENRLLKQRNYELSIRYGKLLQDCNHPFELVFSDSEDKKEISSTSIDIDTLEELAPSEETNKGYYVKASADTQEITHGARDNLMHSASRLNQAAVEQPDGDAASSNASVLTRPLDAQDRQVEPGPESTKTSKALATEAAGEKDSTKNSMSMSKDKQLRNLEERRPSDRRKGSNRLHCAAELEGHTGAIYSVQYAPNRNVVASASFDCTVRLWDIDEQKQVSCLEGHQLSVFDVTWRADGELLGTASLDRTCVLWDVKQEKEVTRFQCSGLAQCIRFSTQAPHISFASDSTGKIYILDSRSPETRNYLDNGTSMVNTLHCFEDEVRLASGDMNGDIKVWDVRNGHFIRLFESKPNSFAISDISVIKIEDSDIEYMAVNSYDNVLRLYRDAHDSSRSEPWVVREIRGHKNRNWPIKNAFFNNVSTQSMVHEMFLGVDYYQMGSRGDITGRKNRQPNLFLITGSAEPYAYVHKVNPQVTPLSNAEDKSAQDIVQRLEGHTDRVYAVCTHPWEPKACTAGADTTIRVWQLPVGGRAFSTTS